MTEATVADKTREVLCVLDPDLAFLASDAAIELDNYLANRSSDITAVVKLATRLKNSIQISDGGSAPTSLMDPATLTVLSEAVRLSLGNTQITSVDELITHASKIADGVIAGTKRRKRKNRRDLQWTRAFCVALSRCAAAYRKSIHDLRPQHPYRR